MCSSSMSMRLVKEDCIIKLEENQEVSLRKGDWIAIFPPILHMDPEVYEDPKVNIHLELHLPLQAHYSSQAFCEICILFVRSVSFLLFQEETNGCSFLWNKSSNFQIFLRCLQVKGCMTWGEKIWWWDWLPFEGKNGNYGLTTINLRLNVGFVWKWIIGCP